jgi:hypothetical protein
MEESIGLLGKMSDDNNKTPQKTSHKKTSEKKRPRASTEYDNTPAAPKKPRKSRPLVESDDERETQVPKLIKPTMRSTAAPKLDITPKNNQSPPTFTQTPYSSQSTNRSQSTKEKPRLSVTSATKEMRKIAIESLRKEKTTAEMEIDEDDPFGDNVPDVATSSKKEESHEEWHHYPDDDERIAEWAAATFHWRAQLGRGPLTADEARDRLQTERAEGRKIRLMAVMGNRGNEEREHAIIKSALEHAAEQFHLSDPRVLVEIDELKRVEPATRAAWIMISYKETESTNQTINRVHLSVHGDLYNTCIGVVWRELAVIPRLSYSIQFGNRTPATTETQSIINKSEWVREQDLVCCNLVTTTHDQVLVGHFQNPSKRQVRERSEIHEWPSANIPSQKRAQKLNQWFRLMLPPSACTICHSDDHVKTARHGFCPLQVLKLGGRTINWNATQAKTRNLIPSTINID